MSGNEDEEGLSGEELNQQEPEIASAEEQEEQGEEQEEEQAAEEVVEEEAVEEEEDLAEQLTPNPVTEEMVGESLSLLCKTGDGLSHAYVRLDLHDREITDIELLARYIHLRYVDLSRNNLRDLSPLNSLSHMLTLRAEQNLIKSAALEPLPYLQYASFSHNRIKSIDHINHPLLEHLVLNFNDISSVSGLEPGMMDRLHTLELRGNRLQTTAGIRLPNLKNLFLGGNILNKLEDLEYLHHLSTLHVRDNQLESLDGFTESMANLQYVNIRGNNISDPAETKKLQMLPKLKALVLLENPISDADDYRQEVLISLRSLARLDKDEFTGDERSEAEQMYRARQLEELVRGDTEIVEVPEEQVDEEEPNVR